MPHPSPAQHKPKTTSYATVLSITHHTKGANLPWFLNLPLDECIDQHTPQIYIQVKVRPQPSNYKENVSAPQRQRQTARHSRDAKQKSASKMPKAQSTKHKAQLK